MKKFIGLIVAAALSTQALAVEEITPNSAFLRAVNPIASKFDSAHYFTAGDEFIGFVGLSKGSEPSVFFFDGSGKTLFAGVAIDLKTNRNYVSEATAKFAAGSGTAKSGASLAKEQKIAFDDAKKAVEREEKNKASRYKRLINWDEAQTIPSIVMGTGQIVATAVIDMNCVHCKRLVEDVVEAQTSGRIKGAVRFILVARSTDRNDSSVLKASGVYGADKKPEALYESIIGTRPVPTRAIVAKGTRDLMRAQNYAAKLGIDSFPVIFGRNLRTGEIWVMPGYSNMNGLLREIEGRQSR